MPNAGSQQLASLIDGSLRVTYVEGAVSQVPAPYSTGWRSLPFSVVAQWRCRDVRFECVGHPARVVPAGHCLLTPANVRHRVTVLASGPGDGDAECRWAHIQAQVFGAHDLYALLGLPLVQAPPAADGLGETCAALAALPRPGQDLSLVTLARRKELDARLIGQLAALAASGAAWDESLRRADRILPALLHIDAHWADPLDSARLAGLTGLSRSRFHAVFAEAIGMAPMDYVRQRRMAEAQRLLVATTERVADIGRRVGYADPFHFSRVFKAAAGSSPAGFRAAARSAWPGVAAAGR